jgi:K(+)-stimulated pyrophosphate-energized sodium pump
VPVNAWVCSFLDVSALSLIMAWFFKAKALGSDTGTRGRTRSFFSRRWARFAGIMATFLVLGQSAAFAQTGESTGGEANLRLPDLSTVNFFGMNGHALLTIGLLFCVGGLLFGLMIYVQLKNLPVHRCAKYRS